MQNIFWDCSNFGYLAKICNSANCQISLGYLKHKSPKSLREIGLYNSAMALSTGFTVGLNVDNYFLVSKL